MTSTAASETMDMGNNESLTRGIFREADGTFAVLTFSRSGTFKTLAGARRAYIRWTGSNPPVAPGFIGCAVLGCFAEFFPVPGREFPELCLDHADAASRERHGYTPFNSID